MSLMRVSTFTCFDSETTGLDKAFHDVVDIGAVVADADLQLIRQIDIRCRASSALPEPEALIATGQSFSELQSRRVSPYQAICQFAQEVRTATPTCFLTWNGIRFDDPMIEHALYRHLLDPYIMKKGRNCRIDLMRLVQLLYALGQPHLVLPVSDAGKVSFKLDRIAPLNGFAEAGAHSALVDARAVYHLARLIAQRAPALWDRAVRLWSQKDGVRNLVASAEV